MGSILVLLATSLYVIFTSPRKQTGPTEDSGQWFDRVWKTGPLPTKIECTPEVDPSYTATESEE